MELGAMDGGDEGTDRWFVMVVGVVRVGHDGVAEGVGLEARLAVEMGDRAVMAVDLMGDDGVGRRWWYGCCGGCGDGRDDGGGMELEMTGYGGTVVVMSAMKVMVGGLKVRGCAVGGGVVMAAVVVVAAMAGGD
ncbi:hypothetical protein F0562_027508 [Nyssa sinensis]|uniref:Uncharacterized protein n=1 Tax=Nyssa sinensis TaxID=561372 RepID=A0A5J5B7P7_9ASTE|nr:hypothetical protein F0562_027508 [Nyssa sinensis]